VLLTDFGWSSFYVGVMKGAVLGVYPDAVLVDLTHDIRPHRVLEGGFVLSCVFDFFPPATVFLAVVDPGVGSERPSSIFVAGERYVVAPDNGLVSDLASRLTIEELYTIDENKVAPHRHHRPVGRTFLGRDLFGPAAALLARGTACRELGSPAPGFARAELPPLEVGRGRVKGRGRYIDPFGNVITNITRRDLEEAFPGLDRRRLRGYIGEWMVEGVRDYYAQAGEGELMLTLDSWDRLEVSVNQGKASELIGCIDPEEVEVEIGA